MKIIVDAFGGDNAPLAPICGAIEAHAAYGVDIILTGDESVIQKVASENNLSLNGITIVHAPDVFTNDDQPSTIRSKAKANTSMAVGLNLLKNGGGDAFVSAGNSGALGAGAMFLVKRIKGIQRVAFAPVMPNSESYFMLIDSGVNTDLRPKALQQFARMGSIYMNKVMGFKNPRVGLANVGSEEHKEWTLSLYNAVNGTAYTNPDDIIIRDVFPELNDSLSFFPVHRGIYTVH